MCKRVLFTTQHVEIWVLVGIFSVLAQIQCSCDTEGALVARCVCLGSGVGGSRLAGGGWRCASVRSGVRGVADDKQ